MRGRSYGLSRCFGPCRGFGSCSWRCAESSAGRIRIGNGVWGLECFDKRQGSCSSDVSRGRGCNLCLYLWFVGCVVGKAKQRCPARRHRRPPTRLDAPIAEHASSPPPLPNFRWHSRQFFSDGVSEIFCLGGFSLLAHKPIQRQTAPPACYYVWLQPSLRPSSRL